MGRRSNVQTNKTWQTNLKWRLKERAEKEMKKKKKRSLCTEERG